VAWARAGIALGALVLTAGVAFSGGSSVDPPAPRGFPGVVPAFFASAGEASRGSARTGTGGPARGAARRDRQWLTRARPLGARAPRWARRIYRRSLLVLRAATDPRSGAVVAGARPGWAYVWPRDGGAVAIAFSSAGYRGEARRIARFLRGLDLGAAARFRGTGSPVPGRGAQGDAAGWVAVAAGAARPAGHGRTGDSAPSATGASQSDASAYAGAPGARVDPESWRGRADYQEGDGGDNLGNALASAFAAGRNAPERRRSARAIARRFGTPRGLARVAGDPGSGLDTAAAWAVRPFPLPALYATVRRTLLNLVAERRTRFGLLPSEGWRGGGDPWTAPTAWCAWSLAALSRIGRRAGRPRAAAVDRRAALSLIGDLRRASTRRGLLPERVDAQSGAPASTTPLTWSHAFAVLAIRELWPGARR